MSQRIRRANLTASRVVSRTRVEIGKSIVLDPREFPEIILIVASLTLILRWLGT
jgi:hypothetical protein